MDILFALFLIAVTLPLLVIAAIVIKLDSEGPVIFRQVRMGRRFRRFNVLKLRSMNIAGEGPAYTLGADPRITRAGCWLRRFKLDELPQLWNVLRGDMSLVGPRPVIPQLTAEFHRAYTELLEVRPGLTDPASLKYCRETEMLSRVPDPMRHFKTVVTPDKIRISRDYLERATVWTDLGVMVMTAFALSSASCRERFSQKAFVRSTESPVLLFYALSPLGNKGKTGSELTSASRQTVQLAREPDYGGNLSEPVSS